uniref:Uncharacterized protein n=1 Tax=Panagrolaimus sp. JU765 TaxID=591449 RepID=A0AC34RB00_9BILA
MRVLLAVFLVGIVFADDVFSNAGQAISQFGQQLQNQGSALAAESQKLANAAMASGKQGALLGNGKAKLGRNSTILEAELKTRGTKSSEAKDKTWATSAAQCLASEANSSHNWILACPKSKTLLLRTA